ncbi:MAG: LLM class flavin-dependent oxidoreductase, partial [Hydrogenophaga sp.]
LFSAQLAAERGLPYAFASHFAPRYLLQAIDLYRHNFKPSAQLAKPYVVVGVPFIGAPTDEEAQYLASSTYQRVLGILTGRRGQLPAPMEGFMERIDPQAKAAIADFLACAVVGSEEAARAGFEQLAEATNADEFMIVSDVFDPALRLRSLDVAAAAMGETAMA